MPLRGISNSLLKLADVSSYITRTFLITKLGKMFSLPSLKCLLPYPLFEAKTVNLWFVDIGINS